MDREKLKEYFANNSEVEFLDAAPRKIRFKSMDHETRYYCIAHQMNSRGKRHKSLAYLLALNENIGANEDHLAACFDFENDVIHPEVLQEPWVTESDSRVLQLAFHLWDYDIPAEVREIFSCFEEIPYLSEAVQINVGKQQRKQV